MSRKTHHTGKVEFVSLGSLPSPPPSPLHSLFAFGPGSAFFSSTTCIAPLSSTRVHWGVEHPHSQPEPNLVVMAQNPYATWTTGVKSEQLQGQGQFAGNLQSSGGSGRRTGSGNDQPDMFSYPGSFAQDDSYARGVPRPQSGSSTSSLSGAMGNAPVSPHSRTSGNTPPSGMVWSPPPTAQEGTYVVLPDEDSTLSSYLATPLSSSPSGAFAIQQQYNMPVYSNSPEALTAHPSGVPTPDYHGQYSYAQSQNRSMHANAALASHPHLVTDLMSISPAPTPTPGSTSRSSRHEKPEDEMRRLQLKVRELETNYELARRRIRELEHEISRPGYSGASSSATARGGLPTPLSTPTLSPAFQQEWHARTEARKKLFCSLNRAGNALCAWHDSRRERRAHPPRMAPPGHLNCGCTYEEALFEESLSRHGVGSYLPGENVRMDPALRNPLLRLLEMRYGYRDGDFERDPLTGTWVGGEGASYWQAQVAQGGHARKQRGEERR